MTRVCYANSVMMWCDSCNQETSVRVNVDAGQHRLGVCHGCYTRARSGEVLKIAHAHAPLTYGRKRRPAARQLILPPEQFR